jgi:thiol-disulfide isomerase/thioredoxin
MLVALLGLAASTCGAAAPAAGDAPPPHVGHTLSGDEVLLTSYAGQAVVITFWATWCPYCLKELPILEGVQDTAGKDQITVIAINTEAPDVFRRATRAMRGRMHLELVSDSDGRARAAFGVHGIPHMVIIGRDGRILSVHSGYSEDSLPAIVDDINRALAPLPAASR